MRWSWILTITPESGSFNPEKAVIGVTCCLTEHRRGGRVPEMTAGSDAGAGLRRRGAPGPIKKYVSTKRVVTAFLFENVKI